MKRAQCLCHVCTDDVAPVTRGQEILDAAIHESYLWSEDASLVTREAKSLLDDVYALLPTAGAPWSETLTDRYRELTATENLYVWQKIATPQFDIEFVKTVYKHLMKDVLEVYGVAIQSNDAVREKI